MRALAAIAVLAVFTTLPPAAATIAADQAGPTCAGRKVTILGTPKQDKLVGTRGPDVIHGLGGGDKIKGHGGNDVICGGDGGDRIAGGAGDDRIYAGRSGQEYLVEEGMTMFHGDTLDGGPGSDLLAAGRDTRPDETDSSHMIGHDTVTFADAPRAVVVDIAAGTATGHGTDRILGGPQVLHGSAYDDVLRGSARTDTIIGGGGADRLVGRGGNDHLRANGTKAVDRRPNDLLGGHGDDYLVDAGGDDTLRGQDGDDGLSAHGTRGADKLYGGAGTDDLADNVVAGRGQVLDGGPGAHDEIHIRAIIGRDGRPARLTGGTTDLEAGEISTVVDDRPFTVRVLGFEDAWGLDAPRWTVLGTGASNSLHAGLAGRVRLVGRGGSDWLEGAPSDDVLDGGSGTDTARPWGGRDELISIERVRD